MCVEALSIDGSEGKRPAEELTCQQKTGNVAALGLKIWSSTCHGPTV
jgi:hypothetical protein